jgi:transcriptional regulator with XRE-family HTH domain
LGRCVSADAAAVLAAALDLGLLRTFAAADAALALVTSLFPAIFNHPLSGSLLTGNRWVSNRTISNARLICQALIKRACRIKRRLVEFLGGYPADKLIVPPAKRAALTLGGYLAAVRSDRGLSLRQVEEMTGKEVSNAYLSQLENDKVKQPSPNILHALSATYDIDYIGLMERAGYLAPQQSSAPVKRHGRAATFAEIDLTIDEEAELLRFLKFMRSEKK